jgi:hypothetical protein
MSIEPTDVDWNGLDASGNDYTTRATPEAVRAGMMINVPTLIRYPNGKIASGNLAKITQTGMAILKRDLLADLSPKGSA